MMRPKIPRLSKSRFMSGLQCHKRLYLELYAPELAEQPDPMTRDRYRVGNAVGVLARKRFPGGVLISHDHQHHAEAEAKTAALLADPTVPAIYEAAFSHDDVAVHTDVLVRCGLSEFDLVEVKSTAGWKEPHLFDLAVQLHVLAGAGVRVRRAYLMHLNRDYVYPGGAYDLQQLFACADLTGQVEALQRIVAVSLGTMRVPLWAEDPPPIATGAQCTSPYVCSFYVHCHVGGPEHPIGELPGQKERVLNDLGALGVSDIRDIPPDFAGLNALQARVRDVLKTSNRYHDPTIASALAALKFPLHFLDFETVMPALPVFAGTRPYQTISFQWSDHVLSEDGSLTHHEFLHDGTGDPRRHFAEAVLNATGSTGSVVVYSGYEAARLRDLENTFPDLAPRLAQLRTRLFDLHPAIKGHIYDPAFRGSFSIKAVLPALVPDLGYADLEIGDGLQASLAYEELRDPGTSVARAAELRKNLLAYCERDTVAMLELYRLLR